MRKKRGANWRPFFVTAANVKCNLGLLASLGYATFTEPHQHVLLPVLRDFLAICRMIVGVKVVRDAFIDRSADPGSSCRDLPVM